MWFLAAQNTKIVGYFHRFTHRMALPVPQLHFFPHQLTAGDTDRHTVREAGTEFMIEFPYQNVIICAFAIKVTSVTHTIAVTNALNLHKTSAAINFKLQWIIKYHFCHCSRSLSHWFWWYVAQSDVKYVKHCVFSHPTIHSLLVILSNTRKRSTLWIMSQLFRFYQYPTELITRLPLLWLA